MERSGTDPMWTLNGPSSNPHSQATRPSSQRSPPRCADASATTTSVTARSCTDVVPRLRTRKPRTRKLRTTPIAGSSAVDDHSLMPLGRPAGWAMPPCSGTQAERATRNGQARFPRGASSGRPDDSECERDPLPTTAFVRQAADLRINSPERSMRRHLFATDRDSKCALKKAPPTLTSDSGRAHRLPDCREPGPAAWPLVPQDSDSGFLSTGTPGLAAASTTCATWKRRRWTPFYQILMGGHRSLGRSLDRREAVAGMRASR